MFGPFRTSRILRALSPLTACAALWLGLQGPAAHAGAVTYDTSARRTVNAGILLLDSTTDTVNAPAAGPSNKDPYLFHILNQRIDIRPFGWSIVNPLAPRTVTQAIQARWAARSGPAYGVGQTITPNMGPYWEVDIQRTSAKDLGQFDILYLGIDQDRLAKFSVTDQQKLLSFVDNGGTLWIEYVGNAISTTKPLDPEANILFKFPLQFAGTSPGGSFAVAGAGTNLPLLTTPYRLSEAEINGLGDKQIGNYYAYDGVSASNPPGPGLLSTVIGNSGQGGQPVLSAGALGAGEIVVSTLGVGNAINESVQLNSTPTAVGENSGPYCGTDYLSAPTEDLKFLSDLLAAVGGHPNEHQNSHNTGNSPNGIPSATRVWTTNGAIPGGSSSPVINGNMAYVTTGNTLRAFDLYPAEDLDGDRNPDDGDVDYSQGSPYDQVWHADVGDLASAPTVAVNPGNGQVAVFVEQKDGSVLAFSGSDGTKAFSTLALPGSDSRGAYSAYPAPAPTFYNGRIYAGGADSSLYIYDVFTNRYTNPTTNPILLVDPNGAAPVVAPPTVGTVTTERGVNDILALITTNNGLYSVFLGARGETLTKVQGPGGTYNTKLASLPSGKMDVTPNPDTSLPYQTYTIPTPSTGYPVTATATGSATTPNFSGYTGLSALLGDYNSDVFNVTGSGPLTRTLVGLSTAAGTPGTNAPTSAPALDHAGNVYYTAGTALFCVHDSPTQAQIKWIFRLPLVSESVTDADGADYTPLQGFTFVGAPVVDEQGLVYVMANNGGNSVVLCFNGQGGVSADVAGVGTNVTISQPFPFPTGTTDVFGNTPSQLGGGQFNINTDGHIEFNNFGQNGSNIGGTKTLYPDLNEPYPVLVQINPAQGQPPAAPVPVALHTNLVWYTAVPGPAASGLTKVGGSLFYVDTGGVLNRVYADPSNAGLSITSKLVTSTTTNAMFGQIGDTGVGRGATPSSTNGVLAISGPAGVSLYTNQVTLVVDNNRVLEMDSDGNAMWAVDSTTKSTLAGGDAPVYNGPGGTAPTNPGRYMTTSLELNRPSSVFELTPNDYLIADTGNNRCVRFDRGGKVIWELTKFANTLGLLRPGEPDSLNQPTSVQVRSYQRANGNTVILYLVSDSGNFRVVEIQDEVDKYHNPVGTQHVLDWVSHTHDVQGRQYRYGSASLYYAPNGKQYVVALVTNRRIATLSRNSATPVLAQLAPANQDTNGGSVVLLDYDPDPTHPFGANGQANGFIAIEAAGSVYTLDVINSLQAYLQPNGKFDLNKTLSPGGAKPSTISLRNPRYLKSYAPPGATGTGRNYLLADDNGVFDLTFQGGQFVAQWGFTQADYKTIRTPISAEGVNGTLQANGSRIQQPYDRSNIPFVPMSVQRTGVRTVGTPGVTVGTYLVANGFGQGETGTGFGDFDTGYTPPGFGGEAFELQTDAGTGGALVTHEVHDNGGALPATIFTGHTISRPKNTGPVTQPTFAYRVQ